MSNDITPEIINEKPQLAIYFANRDMFKVEIDGISFVVTLESSEEKYGRVALKKQRDIYAEQKRVEYKRFLEYNTFND